MTRKPEAAGKDASAPSPKNSSTPKAKKSQAKSPAVAQKKTPGVFSSTPAAKTARKKALPWPAAKVELVPVKDLVPYAKNARVHSQSQVLGIANSMLEYGWTNPVLRDEKNLMIAGHGRILGAEVNIDRGHKEFELAPVMTAIGWTEAQKRAYAIADNQLALQAGWDPKLLQSELKEISAFGFDMSLLGFSEQELSRHLGRRASGLTDPDATPEPPKDPVSRVGDLWLCGPHRILCGDSTQKTDVGRLLGNARVVLMATDPPYGVNYDPTWRVGIRGQIKDVRARGKVENDGRIDWAEAFALFPGNVAYIWSASYFIAQVQHSIESVGFAIRSQIIWRKPHFTIGRGDYHWQHEPCWYAVRKGEKSNWKGGRKQSTMWDIPGLNPMGRGKRGAADAETDHSTQKPAECMRRPIENNTDVGDAVYDPFLGSGTTLIAAQELGRVCYAIELNPVYVDVAVRRWQEFTGETAKLSGRELSFEEIAGERKHGRSRTKADADKPARADRKRRAPAVARAGAEASVGQA